MVAATVTLTQYDDASIAVVLPVTPTEVEEDGTAEELSFVVVGLGTHTMPRGRAPQTFPLSGTLPGDAARYRPTRVLSPDGIGVAGAIGTDPWQPPSVIADQVRTWTHAGTMLKLGVQSLVGYLERVVYLNSFKFVRTGAFGDLKYALALTEWRVLKLGLDDGSTDASGVSGGTTSRSVLDSVLASLTGGLADPPTPSSYTVLDGDTLSLIAKKTLGDTGRWREIADANADTVPDPNNISVGQVLVIPGGSAPPPAAAVTNEAPRPIPRVPVPYTPPPSDTGAPIVPPSGGPF